MWERPVQHIESVPLSLHEKLRGIRYSTRMDSTGVHTERYVPPLWKSAGWWIVAITAAGILIVLTPARLVADRVRGHRH